MTSQFRRSALFIVMGGFFLCYLSVVMMGHRHALQHDAITSVTASLLLRAIPNPEWNSFVSGTPGSNSFAAVAPSEADDTIEGKNIVGVIKETAGTKAESVVVSSISELSFDDRERRRRIMFSDLSDLPSDVRGPELYTSYQRATAFQRAEWFKGGIECKETCCVRRVAVSLDQDEEHLITTIDGVDLADVFVHGHTKQKHFEWAGTNLSPKMVPCLLPGTVVWADHEGGGVNKFFDMFRPNITVPYVIISGETDGPEPMGPHGRRSLESDDMLLKWYGINPSYVLGADLPKFQMMHLGLSRQHKQQQDLLHLQRSRAFQNPFSGDAKKRWTRSEFLANATDTTPVLFVKFGINERSRHRKVPYAMACDGRTMEPLDDVSCNSEKRSSPRETYAAASKYLFGLSPPGLGNDCYRNYELLFLGIIPIVKRQPEYDVLFDGLPIIQLDNWDHSQTDLLKIMRDYISSPRFRDNDFNGWERLYLKYWRRMLLKDTRRDREVVKDPSGREYYQAYVYSEYSPQKISSWWPPKD